MATKIEVYAATLMVIDETCLSGQNHLAALSKGLALPDTLIDALHVQASQQSAAA